MNVCLLNDSFPPMIDGVANTVMNYARVMSETEGMSAVVGTPRYPRADYTGYPYPVVPYQSFNISTLVEGYRAGNPLNLKAINRLVEFQPDIIHTHCPVMSTVMARVIRNETDAPVIFTYHTKFDEDIAKAVSLHILQEAGANMLVNNISACDEVWTVSRGAGENLKALGYEGEYRVVSNGVDFPKGRTSEEEAQLAAEKFDVPQDLPVFLYVGRIMAYKGLPLIVEALKLLSEAGRDYRMVFIGGGVDEEEIQKLAIEAGLAVDVADKDGTVRSAGNSALPGKLIFTGPVRDRQVLRAWNTRAHLFLFPSTYDTNGIVVREAAACALASVLIKDSCAAEEVTDGRNGYLIEESAEAMEKVLEEVCKNPAHAREVGEHAMNELYFSWDDSVHCAMEYYQEVLEKKNAGLLSGRNKIPSDVAVDAAARLDEAGRAIRKASRAIWRPPVLLAQRAKDKTKRLVELPAEFYKTAREKIRGRESEPERWDEFPEGVWNGPEGMQENYRDETAEEA